MFNVEEVDPQLATGMAKIRVGSDMTGAVEDKEKGWVEWL
jgi:hypothetical protein